MMRSTKIYAERVYTDRRETVSIFLAQHEEDDGREHWSVHRELGGEHSDIVIADEEREEAARDIFWSICEDLEGDGWRQLTVGDEVYGSDPHGRTIFGQITNFDYGDVWVNTGSGYHEKLVAEVAKCARVKKVAVS